MTDDRVALVTGAAGGGVGAHVARRLAARGCRVAVTDIHERRTKAFSDELAALHPGRIVGLPLDAGDRERAAEVVAAVTETFGPIQILVNNAAVDVLGTFFDYDLDDWDRTVAVNLTGPWYLTRLVMPGMRDAGGGAIVNIGSIANGLGGSGFEGAYAITKGGLAALSRAASRDGAPYGIRAVTVSPGPIGDTRVILTNPGVLDHPDVTSPTGTYPTADEVAAVVEFLTTDAARHIAGETVNVNAGAYMSP